MQYVAFSFQENKRGRLLSIRLQKKAVLIFAHPLFDTLYDLWVAHHSFLDRGLVSI